MTHIYEDEIWIPSLLTGAQLKLSTEGIRPRDSIGLIGGAWIRCRLAQEHNVQKVVDEIHLCGWVSIGTIHFAVKRRGNIVGGLPDIGEF